MAGSFDRTFQETKLENSGDLSEENIDKIYLITDIDRVIEKEDFTKVSTAMLFM